MLNPLYLIFANPFNGKPAKDKRIPEFVCRQFAADRLNRVIKMRFAPRDMTGHIRFMFMRPRILSIELNTVETAIAGAGKKHGMGYLPVPF